MADGSFLDRLPQALQVTSGSDTFYTVPVVLVDSTGTRLSALSVTTSPTLTSRTVTGSSAAVTTSSGQILASNASRKTATFTNTSDTARVSLAFGGSATLDAGITLMPGSSFTMGTLDFSTAAVHAIGSASATVSVSEWV